MRYITKGDVKNYVLQPANCDGTPVDLSNKTIKLMIKKDKDALDSTAIYNTSIVNPTTNTVSFEIPSTTTATYEVGDYYIGAKLYETVDGVAKNREIWCEELKVVNGLFTT